MQYCAGKSMPVDGRLAWLLSSLSLYAPPRSCSHKSLIWTSGDIRDISAHTRRRCHEKVKTFA